MQDESNPFEAPTSMPGVVPASSEAQPRIRPVRLLLGWLAVFLSNLPVPLMFSVGMGDWQVKLGIVSAIAVLASAGGMLCLRSDRIGMAAILGGGLVAMSQVFPFMQIMAGMVALVVTSAVGLGEPSPMEGIEDPSGWGGGFLTTMITGALLIKAALALGLFVLFVTPGRWWGVSG